MDKLIGSIKNINNNSQTPNNCLGKIKSEPVDTEIYGIHYHGHSTETGFHPISDSLYLQTEKIKQEQEDKTETENQINIALKQENEVTEGVSWVSSYQNLRQQTHQLNGTPKSVINSVPTTDKSLNNVIEAGKNLTSSKNVQSPLSLRTVVGQTHKQLSPTSICKAVLVPAHLYSEFMQGKKGPRSSIEPHQVTDHAIPPAVLEQASPMVPVPLNLVAGASTCQNPIQYMIIVNQHPTTVQNPQPTNVTNIPYQHQTNVQNSQQTKITSIEYKHPTNVKNPQPTNVTSILSQLLNTQKNPQQANGTSIQYKDPFTVQDPRQFNISGIHVPLSTQGPTTIQSPQQTNITSSLCKDPTTVQDPRQINVTSLPYKLLITAQNPQQNIISSQLPVTVSSNQLQTNSIGNKVLISTCRIQTCHQINNFAAFFPKPTINENQPNLSAGDQVQPNGVSTTSRLEGNNHANYTKIVPVSGHSIKVDLSNRGYPSACIECNQPLSSQYHQSLKTCDLCTYTSICSVSMCNHLKNRHGFKFDDFLNIGYGFLRERSFEDSLLCECGLKITNQCQEMANHLATCTVGHWTCRIVRNTCIENSNNEGTVETLNSADETEPEYTGDTTGAQTSNKDSLICNLTDLPEETKNHLLQLWKNEVDSMVQEDIQKCRKKGYREIHPDTLNLFTLEGKHSLARLDPGTNRETVTRIQPLVKLAQKTAKEILLEDLERSNLGIVKLPKELYKAKIGETVTIIADIKRIGNFPVKMVWWQKIVNGNSTPITPRSNISKYKGSFPHKPSLTIMDIDMRDAGDYICMVGNESACSSSNKATLTIDVRSVTERDLPVVKVKKTSYVVNMCDIVTLECSITSKLPITNIFWMKDCSNQTKNSQRKDRCSPYNHISALEPSLTIKNVTIHDSGKYVCIAENTAGRGVSSSVELHVNEHCDLHDHSPSLTPKLSNYMEEVKKMLGMEKQQNLESEHSDSQDVDQLGSDIGNNENQSRLPWDLGSNSSDSEEMDIEELETNEKAGSRTLCSIEMEIEKKSKDFAASQKRNLDTQNMQQKRVCSSTATKQILDEGLLKKNDGFSLDKKRTLLQEEKTDMFLSSVTKHKETTHTTISPTYNRKSSSVSSSTSKNQSSGKKSDTSVPSKIRKSLALQNNDVTLSSAVFVQEETTDVANLSVKKIKSPTGLASTDDSKRVENFFNIVGCGLCDQTFPSLHDLQDHLNLFHARVMEGLPYNKISSEDDPRTYFERPLDPGKKVKNMLDSINPKRQNETKSELTNKESQSSLPWDLGSNRSECEEMNIQLDTHESEMESQDNNMRAAARKTQLDIKDIKQEPDLPSIATNQIPYGDGEGKTLDLNNTCIFRCGFCQKKFSCTGKLREHVQTFHLEKNAVPNKSGTLDDVNKSATPVDEAVVGKYVLYGSVQRNVKLPCDSNRSLIMMDKIGTQSQWAYIPKDGIVYRQLHSSNQGIGDKVFAKTTTGEELPIVGCGHCDTTFTSIRQLSDHIRKYHDTFKRRKEETTDLVQPKKKHKKRKMTNNCVIEKPSNSSSADDDAAQNKLLDESNVSAMDMQKDVIQDSNVLQQSKETRKEKHLGVAFVTRFFRSMKEKRDIQFIPPKELDPLLAKFLLTVRKKDGSEFKRNFLRSIISSVDRKLKETKYGHSIIGMKRGEFKLTRQAMRVKKNKIPLECVIDTSENEQFSVDQKSENTKRHTECDIAFVVRCLRYQNEEREIHLIPPNELDPLLADFILTLKKNDGSEYGHRSYCSIIRSVDRKLKEKKYGHSIFGVKDGAFMQTREAVRLKEKWLVEQGKGNNPRRAQPLTDEDIDMLYNKNVLGWKTPRSLLNTLWLNNSVQFGLVRVSEHYHLRWGDITLNTDSDGRRYLELKKRPGTNTEENASDVHEELLKIYETDEERNPVKIYEIYSAKRPVHFSRPYDPFYLRNRPIPENHPETDNWFHKITVGRKRLLNMIQTMIKLGGLETNKRLTNFSTKRYILDKLSQKCIEPTDGLQKSNDIKSSPLDDKKHVET